MLEENLSGGAGQSSLPLDAHVPFGTSGVRIRGLDGLAEKIIPERAGVHIKALTYWSSFMPREGGRSALHAPALYVDSGDGEGSESGKGIRLLAPFGKQIARVRHCTKRYVLSSKKLSLQGDGPPQDQQVFRSRTLYTLSHLISGIRHIVPGVTLYPATVRGRRPMMAVEPSPMLSRLGYSICGDNYKALEQDYAELAGCMVRLEEWDSTLQCWSVTYEEPLIEFFDTGRRCIVGGREISATGSRRRHRNWRLSLGRPLLEMLSCRASEFTGLAPELWRAAGQSVPAQWLVCYLSGHGYDAGEFLPHRLDTLAFRMRACSDDFLNELKGSSLELTDFLKDERSEVGHPRRATEKQFDRMASEQAKAFQRAADSHTRQRRSLRDSIRQVWRGLKRLHNSHAFSRMGILSRDGDRQLPYPSSGPGAFRVVGASDLLTLQRWPAVIERHLCSIPPWVFREHRSLLEAAGRSVGSVAAQVPSARRQLDWILTRLQRAPRGSNVSSQLLVQLAWLAEAVSGVAGRLRFERASLSHSPPPFYGPVGV